jgi:adenosine deaminase
MNVADYIKKVPKAELHLHIEGTFARINVRNSAEK